MIQYHAKNLIWFVTWLDVVFHVVRLQYNAQWESWLLVENRLRNITAGQRKGGL